MGQQTTDHVTMKNCYVEISLDNANWTDISGWSSSVEVDGGGRQIGEAYTFTGETVLLALGKREPVEVTLKIVYTEEDTGPAQKIPFDIVREAFEQGKRFYLRWTPLGEQSEAFVYTIGGYISSLGYPTGEAGSGDPILVEFTVKSPVISKAIRS